MQTKVWVISEHAEDGTREPIAARLTLEAAVSVCKLAPNRSFKKLVATKDHGPTKFDD